MEGIAEAVELKLRDGPGGYQRRGDYSKLFARVVVKQSAGGGNEYKLILHILYRYIYGHFLDEYQFILFVL